MRNLYAAILMSWVFIVPTKAQAESGFMDDYSILKAREDQIINKLYVAPQTLGKLPKYNKLMIDQPEVFVSPETKYKGAKPDHLKVLSDTLRAAMIERFEAGGYTIVDAPGPDVLYMRWAITDLYLKKKHKNILAYTPVGFVVHTSTQLAIRDLWKKIDIVELNLETEFLDSESGELIAAAMLERGHRKSKGSKQELVSWEDLAATMHTFGERLRCNLDNSRHLESEREDCLSIVAKPEER